MISKIFEVRLFMCAPGIKMFNLSLLNFSCCDKVSDSEFQIP